MDQFVSTLPRRDSSQRHHRRSVMPVGRTPDKGDGMDSRAVHKGGDLNTNEDEKRATGTVYILSNQDTGNSVTVFDRAANGGLTRLATYPTGGLGGGNSID